MKPNFKTLAAGVTALTLLSPALLASSHTPDTAKLLQQIKQLEQRITVLESSRSFTQFMPDFAERFHVMHRAGLAGDWAVAAHELAEMKRLMEQAPDIDAKDGKLMQAMLGPSMEKLDKTIDQADSTMFKKTLVETVNTCNACHAATGSPFIQVKLNASNSLSMRHPHKFMARHAPEGHEHGHEHGMHDAKAHQDGESHHDEQQQHHDEKTQ